MLVVVLGVGVHHRVAGGDDAGQDVVEAVGSADVEARRLAGSHVVQIHPGEAVGLLLAHDGGVFAGDQLGHGLQGVSEFVCQHAVDRHVAEILLRDGHEYAAVPGDHVAPGGVEGVHQIVGLVVTHDRAVRVVGVIRHQLVDGPEGPLQRRRVVGLPELLDVVDRQQGQLVDGPVVGVEDGTRRRRPIRLGSAGSVGGRQPTDPERIVEYRHRASVDRGATGRHDEHRSQASR